MNQERYLKDRFGNKPHFAVPEGYFDNLNARIMQTIGFPVENKGLTMEKQKGTFCHEKEHLLPGKRAPFTTQKGTYSEKPFTPRLQRIRPLIAAASVVGIIICASIAFHLSVPSNEAQSEISGKSMAQGGKEVSSQKKSSFEESADYMMLDDDDLYAYLSE